jgi:hypothetical protein
VFTRATFQGAYAGRALFLVRNSQSSRVKMSLVTAAIEKRVRRRLQSASMSAVLPEPTGLSELASFQVAHRGRKVKEVGPMVKATHPPMPMVNARSSQSRPSMRGISRPRKLPGPSRISWVWPWSAAACECDALSCEWLLDMSARTETQIVAREVPWEDIKGSASTSRRCGAGTTHTSMGCVHRLLICR